MVCSTPRRDLDDRRGVDLVTTRDPSRESVHGHKDRQARLKIREGLRLILTGIEELWRLPRSFETKKEQGRR